MEDHFESSIVLTGNQSPPFDLKNEAAVADENLQCVYSVKDVDKNRRQLWSDIYEVRPVIDWEEPAVDLLRESPAKRNLLNELDSNSVSDQPHVKRTTTIPSSASVIGEAVLNSFQISSSESELLLKRAVIEELESDVTTYNPRRSSTTSPSLGIQSHESSSLKLVFTEKLSLPIFTDSRITDIKKNPLQILVADTGSNEYITPANFYHQPIKIELVVLDGDFPPGDSDTWTPEQFESNIVKERTGKGPLLIGDVNVTARDGVASVGEIEFTDNSSWIKGRKFRIGAKVVNGSHQGFRIFEAITEAFVVKNLRGEWCKKHYPPKLEDEVWRLEKIAKDGKFHRRLAVSGIKTVQDFLKLSTVEPQKLRSILGTTDRTWEVIVQHARTSVVENKHARRTCVVGEKPYIFGLRIFSVMNFIIEIPTMVFEQLSYKNQMLYGTLVMSTSILTVIFAVTEFIYRGRKERVVWRWRRIPWLYHPDPAPSNNGSKLLLFGSTTDIIGLVSAVLQCIFSMIAFYFYGQHEDNPIKISALPPVFAFYMMWSQFLQNSSTGG